ncbi:hypothetical protein Tco_0167842 [Tanacetum coccineum]
MHNNIWRLVKSSFPHNAMEQEDILSGVHVFYDTLTLKEMIPQHDEAETETTCLQRTNCIFKLKRKLFSDFKLGENTLNVQMLKTNLFLGIGKFTSRDGESWSRITPYQNEVNDICSEILAKSANPLALVAAAQPYSDNYYQAPKPQRTNTTSSSTRPSASTRHKGKEIAKPVTPQSESVSEKDSDPEQAQRDKDMQKNLALPAKYFKRLYKPTNNNLPTSSNSRNKTKDTTPRMGYSALTVKDLAMQSECIEAKAAEQADMLADTDEEIDEQELEAHYSFMAKIQEVLPEESSSTDQPLEQVQNHDENNVFANERRHSEQPESINDTYVLEKDDSNVTPDSSNICNNDNQVDQNAAECVDERAALANLIANLTLDTEENKTILKQLKKANASLTQEMEECKTNLDETNRALGEATSYRDSCLIALQNKQNEFEKYKAFNDRTIDYDILQTKLNETLGLLALKDIEIKEGLKTKAYEILVLNQKHDELVKKSLLTKSQFEGQLKEKSKVISDLKVKEGRDIDKMIEMDKQIKFLNEILYKRNQSIQTIHMLAPKCATYNGRSTFANPKEETVTLEMESRSKLNKDTVKPYDYTYQNSLYEIFKPPSKTYLDQLEHTKEVRKTMWRQMFVRTKTNIAKNVAFLPYVESLEKEIDELESEKADFSNIYDLFLEECVSKDVICSYLHSLSDLNAHTGLQCLYLHKVKECECLAQKLSKQTESVNKEVHNNLLKSFSKLEKHSISLELALQQCKEQMKNNSVCKENGSNVFRKEREQYHEIQDLKAQMQDKNIAISELKKLIEKCKGKSVETQFDKPSVVRQPNAQRIPKPSVLGKPTPFSNSPEMRSFQTKQSVNKTNVSDGLFKQVTQQNLPQIRKQAVRNTNVIAPGPSRNCPKHVSHQSPREKVGSNDMVHNYYLEKAKKSAQLQKDKDVNGKPSMIDPARLPNTANGCKPKPRNWQASMSSRVSNKDVHLGEHRKQKPFLKFNELQCPTCKKCLYSANHDECVLEYLSRLNPRASAQNKDAKSHKTTKRYMPVEKSSASKKPERQIPTGHRFSNKKTTTVPEKTKKSCIRNTIQKSKALLKELYENTKSGWK